MSLIITVYTNEGIIMASDSRTTYSRRNILPDGSVENHIGTQITDTTYKTFLCSNTIGISTCGSADIQGVPLAGYIEKFIAKQDCEKRKIKEIAQGLIDEFSGYNPIPQIIFYVAGYDENDSMQHICEVNIAGKAIREIPTNDQGAAWAGETEILARLLSPVALKKEDGTYLDFNCNRIGFNFFTLQDAIDFAKYAIDVSIKTMAFQDCIKTVGGPIDILAIKSTGAFWIQRKELHA